MSITKYLNLFHLRKLLSALGQRFYAIEQRQDNLQSQMENFAIPTKVSDLNNDSGFQTQAQVNALIAAAGDDDTTYAISMSGNVITLTGSDGNTSTVTLPVYTGGVT